MIKYSEMENSFTVDCDACGNFYPTTTDKLDLTCDLYRFCSDRCKRFAFDRMKLITQTIKPTLEPKEMPKKEVCPNCTCCDLVESQGELGCYDCGYIKEKIKPTEVNKDDHKDN